MATVDDTDILKTDAPVLEFYTHMNRAFLLLDKNSECFRGQDYSTLTISCTSYNENQDGDIDLNSVIKPWVRTYKRYQINDRFEPEGFPPYNIWIDLSNNWHEIQLYFSFSPDDELAGGSVGWNSKISKYPFDNRNSMLVGQNTSQYMIGSVKENLEKTKDFKVYFDIEPSVYNVGDLLVENNGTIIREIVEVEGESPNQTVRIIPATDNYKDIIMYILYEDRFPRVLDQFKNIYGDIPELVSFRFKVYLNKNTFWIYFSGNFQYVVKLEQLRKEQEVLNGQL